MNDRNTFRLRPVLAAALIIFGLGAGLTACGGSGGTTETATAPDNLDEPATGTLRVFSWEDSVTPEMMDPFQKQNPDLDIQTATFDSNSEAAAKISSGFETDIVEVCLDEAKPLITRNMLRPIDTSAVKDWDQLAFRDSPGIRHNGDVIMVPLNAGPQGVIVNTEEVDREVTSFADIWDPEFKGRAALEGDYSLPPIAETALALGIDDPMNMDEEELNKVKDYMVENRDQLRALWRSDSDLVNLFKTGEVVISDGNSAQVKRMQEAGIPVKWIAPAEGTISWVCGFAISSEARNLAAAYRLINWQASPKAQAIRGRNGYVMVNPAAMPLLPKDDRATADPSSLDHAIPETYPPINDQWIKAFEEFQAS